MKVLSIGRNSDCNIVYDDMMVSRRHALIKIYPTGKYEIVSTGTNGTKVNGNLIASNAPYPLKRGDSVTFANVARLDWRVIPNPLRPYYMAGIGVLAVIVAIGIGIGVSKLVKSYTAEPVKEETKELTTTQADSTANKEKQTPDSIKEKKFENYTNELETPKPPKQVPQKHTKTQKPKQEKPKEKTAEEIEEAPSSGWRH